MINQDSANDSNNTECEPETSGPHGTPPSSGTMVCESSYHLCYLWPQIHTRPPKLVPVQHHSSMIHCNQPPLCPVAFMTYMSSQCQWSRTTTINPKCVTSFPLKIPRQSDHIGCRFRTCRIVRQHIPPPLTTQCKPNNLFDCPVNHVQHYHSHRRHIYSHYNPQHSPPGDA